MKNNVNRRDWRVKADRVLSQPTLKWMQETFSFKIQQPHFFADVSTFFSWHICRRIYFFSWRIFNPSKCYFLQRNTFHFGNCANNNWCTCHSALHCTPIIRFKRLMNNHHLHPPFPTLTHDPRTHPNISLETVTNMFVLKSVMLWRLNGNKGCNLRRENNSVGLNYELKSLTAGARNFLKIQVSSVFNLKQILSQFYWHGLQKLSFFNSVVTFCFSEVYLLGSCVGGIFGGIVIHLCVFNENSKYRNIRQMRQPH